MKNDSNNFYEEAIFRLKRSGYFGCLLLILLVFLISFIIVRVKVIDEDYLPSNLETLFPIFYGIIALLIVADLFFITFNTSMFYKDYKNELKKINFLNGFVITSFFLPFIFSFFSVKLINNYRFKRNIKNKKNHFKKKNVNINNEHVPYKPFQDENGTWWYFDENNKLYYAIDTEWYEYSEKN